MNSTVLESHALWWREAGVDVAIREEPIRWLDADAAVHPIESPAPAPSVPNSDARPAPASESPAPAPPVAVEAKPWPTDHAAFLAFLSEESAYPGGAYARKRLCPAGPADAPLAIITDLPSPADIEHGEILSAAEGELLGAMLAAIGLERANSYIMPLATSRPASGEIPEEDSSAITDLTRHHLGLLPARHLLILGDYASRVVLDAPMLKQRGRLRQFNHNGREKAATNCFHPRTLLARPAFKRQAWQDLQLLKRELV